MDRLFRLLFLIYLSQTGDNSISRGATINPFPLGTIGCLVSDVCEQGEICTNDLLFGSCQSIVSRALHGENKYNLRTTEIERLEDEIGRLIEAGFTWKDAYTQCTLQNTLLEFSRGRTFNRKMCEDALVSSDWTQEVNNEIAKVLLQVLEKGEVDLDDIAASQDDDEAEQDVDLVNSNKRDEIVQVHKYFDRSTGQLKRDPFFDDSSYVPQREDPRPYYFPGLQNVPYKETTNKGSYRVFDNEDQDSNSQEPESEPEMTQTSDLVPLDDASSLDEVQQAVEDEETKVEGSPSIKSIIENLVLTPEDELTLEGLLEGTITAKDLDLGQQQRLQSFIKGLILVLESSGRRVELMDDNDDEAVSSIEDVNLSDKPARLTTNDLPQWAGGPYTNQLVDMDKVRNAEQSQAASVADKVDLLVDKKTIDDDIDEEVKEGVSEGQPVNGHFMYLELSKAVSTSGAWQFVHNLTEILKLPPGLLELNDVGPGHIISLRIRPDPEGKWDVETIVKEAQSANSVLEKSTGITVLGAGVGTELNRVEVKQDNRYVVLTFSLVGTIAGVVLTVVAIYLCKRHSRSKQKLAQIATNGDGSEASKDYQDLCRQRMQGKTSEKPEPLHAASRIGSVSESQVRSPSSRSSTSSWSEEPAATNMDISTGHIVLSYMEDHLKNQDRLDREWEAVSGYVADPSSTKVANDQSNMRKNRFADILPYDHSRVNLSSNSVSNSDYINASFITDHDPRNPAYIATQGPLPHTVADFWQMIWEQGSVVIVMLTKLVEDGTSLCHRYWPEEGSDLYHIYEVHLVSEHIWCDDHLVRSFYLKNLQTNETRTVTQFHFLTWPELSVPASIKALLDFRRKVNKSFRGRSCPIVVHCSDGCGRTGTYCLIDMVLNKMAKGTKEIDMAATLEHIRDQRMSMVKTKEQFQFSLAAVAEEVHAILKALPQ